MDSYKSEASTPSAREFVNSFPGYNKDSFSGLDEIGAANKIVESLEKNIKDKIKHLLKELEKNYEVDWKNPSVYTGTAGMALMYYHLYLKFHNGTKAKETYLLKSVELIKKTLKNLNHKAQSFLCGDGGPLAVAAVIFKANGQDEESKKCLKKLISLVENLEKNQSESNELLYGKSGVLFAFLFVQKHLGNNAIDGSIINLLSKAILKNGKSLGKLQNMEPPLMYEWHEKKYLGAAHGISGIIYILLNLKNDGYIAQHLNDLIHPTVDYLLTLKYTSGNYPSSIGSTSSDKLVQWCHGAPGMIYLFLAAYNTFGGDKYLNAAKECAKVIWKRGLLKKGYGLCHGVAGNAYSFLALYNATKNIKYLYFALKFAEWCLDYGKHGCKIPDHPYSLFEGTAGTIYFLVDILEPRSAKFPAFEL